MINNSSSKGILITGGAWFHEIPGGAYKAATELAEYLAQEGHRVFYLAASEQENVQSPIHHNGVEIWRYLKPTAPSPSLGNLLSHFYYTRTLAQKICQIYPIEYLNGHDPLKFLASQQALEHKLIKSSFSVHSPLVQEQKAHWDLSLNPTIKDQLSLKQALALKLFTALESVVYRRANIIQTNSEFTLKEITRDYPNAVGSKATVRHLWVDLDRFQPCHDKAEVRHRLGEPWQCNEIVFFTLRRLVPRMGLDELIKAVGLLRDSNKRCRLIIGGSGPERQNLETLVADLALSDRVFFLGRVLDEDLPACYQAADCFVLPTKALECFGLIILEAYASGVPAIATNIGSIPEIVNRHNPSWLVDYPSKESLFEKMDEFVNGELYTEPYILRKVSEMYEYKQKASHLADLLFT